MIFKFPKRKIVLDCFTTHEHVLRTAPVLPAVKLIPEWWRNLPSHYYDKGNTFFPAGTMKHCSGMVDYYKKSIVLPLWSDLAIRIDSKDDFAWQFSDQFSTISPHNVSKQATGFLSGYIHLKLNSPWLFKTKEDIQWVWSHPVYSYPHSNDVVSMPAVVNYLHQPGTNINLMIDASTPKVFTIPQGQPLVHITPMSDRKVEVVRHLISKEEFMKIEVMATPITFLEKYTSLSKRVAQFKGCPFHNHMKGDTK